MTKDPMNLEGQARDAYLATEHASTAVEETIEGWACTDCIMFIANGETPPEMSEEETEEWIQLLANKTAGYHVSLGGVHVEGCTAFEDGTDCYCETEEFSMSRCDTCGSGLGGARYAVTFWAEVSA